MADNVEITFREDGSREVIKAIRAIGVESDKADKKVSALQATLKATKIPASIVAGLNKVTAALNATSAASQALNKHLAKKVPPGVVASLQTITSAINTTAAASQKLQGNLTKTLSTKTAPAVATSFTNVTTALNGVSAAAANMNATLNQYGKVSVKVINSNRAAAQSASTTSNKFKELAQSFTILDGPLGATAGRLRAISTAFSTMNVVAVGLGLTFAALTAAFTGIIRVAAQSERQMARISALTEGTGFAAGRTAGQINELAQDIAANTLQSSASIRDAASVLLTFRTVSKDTFDTALRAAADMAEVMGTDAKGSVLQLAKALENPIQGITALSDAGVVFTMEQKKIVEALVNTGQQLEAQKLILEEVNKQYGGAAEGAKKLAEGQNTLAGSYAGLTAALTEAAEVINDNGGFTERLAKRLDQLSSAVQIATGYVPDFFETFRNDFVNTQNKELGIFTKTLKTLLGFHPLYSNFTDDIFGNESGETNNQKKIRQYGETVQEVRGVLEKEFGSIYIAAAKFNSGKELHKFLGVSGNAASSTKAIRAAGAELYAALKSGQTQQKIAAERIVQQELLLDEQRSENIEKAGTERVNAIRIAGDAEIAAIVDLARRKQNAFAPILQDFELQSEEAFHDKRLSIARKGYGDTFDLERKILVEGMALRQESSDIYLAGLKEEAEAKKLIAQRNAKADLEQLQKEISTKQSKINSIDAISAQNDALKGTGGKNVERVKIEGDLVALLLRRLNIERELEKVVTETDSQVTNAVEQEANRLLEDKLDLTKQLNALDQASLDLARGLVDQYATQDVFLRRQLAILDENRERIKQLGGDVESELGLAYARVTGRLQDELQAQQQILNDFSSGVAQSFEQALGGVIASLGKGSKDVLKQLEESLRNLVSQAAAQNLVDALFGRTGPGGEKVEGFIGKGGLQDTIFGGLERVRNKGAETVGAKSSQGVVTDIQGLFGKKSAAEAASLVRGETSNLPLYVTEVSNVVPFPGMPAGLQGVTGQGQESLADSVFKGFERGSQALAVAQETSAAEQAKALQGPFSQFQEGIGGVFKGVLGGFGGLFRGLLGSLAQLVGGGGDGGGGIGGFLLGVGKAFVGSYFGGAGTATESVAAKATGGIIPPYRSAIVGERGRELATAGSTPMRISPMPQSAAPSQGKVVVNVYDERGGNAPPVQVETRQEGLDQVISVKVRAEVNKMFADGSIDRNFAGASMPVRRSGSR